MKRKTELAGESSVGHDLAQCAEDLADYVRTAAKEGLAVHEVEKGIWHRVLRMGHGSLKLFFRFAGDGDVGEEVQLPDGSVVRRLPGLHERDYHSVFGVVPVERFVYGTREGQKIEYVPLDARLQLPESKFSYLLQEWDRFMVVEEPYSGVSDRLGRILGFSQSVDSLERMNRGMAAAVPEFFDSLPTPSPDQEGKIIVVSADGKGVPMRRDQKDLPIEAHESKKGPKPDTKKMALLGTVYTVDTLPRTPEDVVASLFRDPKTKDAEKTKRPDRPEPKNKRVRASLARSEDGKMEPAVKGIFGWMGQEVAERNAGATKKTVVVLMDGQGDLWRAANAYLVFVQVVLVHILDLLHVTPRLWTAANILYPSDRGSAVGFVKNSVTLILRGEVVSVIQSLREMAESSGLSGKKEKELEAICSYFEKNKDRMRYNEYLEAGYPIATGVIEGACRHLVKDRMERSGMRWVPTGAQAMLDLRSVHLSGLWDEFTEYRIKRETQRLYPHPPSREGEELARAA